MNIEGIIGIGKTTLAKGLAKHFNWEYHPEPVENNPYLCDYYRDEKRWSFEMQMFLLSKRFEAHQKAIWNKDSRGQIFDRSIFGDTCFAAVQHTMGFMDDRSYQTYLSHFNVMKHFLLYPDLFISLNASVDTCLNRIKDRNRTAERPITKEYLTTLSKAYRKFINEISQWVPVLEVNWETFGSMDDITNQIMQFVETPSQFKRGLTLI